MPTTGTEDTINNAAASAWNLFDRVTAYVAPAKQVVVDARAAGIAVPPVTVKTAQTIVKPKPNPASMPVVTPVTPYGPPAPAAPAPFSISQWLLYDEHAVMHQAIVGAAAVAVLWFLTRKR